MENGKFTRIISCILIFLGSISASDVLVWQGQYYTGTTFNTGTFEFNFTVYDASTGGVICYSNASNLSTGNFGEWRTEQSGVSAACDNASKDYYLNINIEGADQAPRRRLVIFNFLRKDVNETTTGNLTVGEKITLAFGEVIGNTADGWVNITGNLDLGHHNLTTTGLGEFAYMDKIDQAVAPGIPATNTLRLYSEDVKGFSFYGFVDDTGMVRKLVRDSVIVVKNVGGTTIPASRAVYATGSEDNVPTIGLAKADSATTMPAIGVTLESIANDSYGRVMQVGLIENVNTNPFSEGDILYISDVTAGAPKNTVPLVPSLKQEIGTILVKDASAGAIQIVARSVQQDETGSAQNTWSLGDGLAGTKKIMVNNGFLGNLSWTPTADREIIIPDASGTMGVGTGSIHQAVCWKTATTLGYCSDAVNATGGCTCN